MELRLNIEGATPEELARGIAAAEAVFSRAGITALQGAEGLFALEGWDIKGFPEDDQPTEDEDQAASVWMEADEAATTACRAGWPEDKVPGHQIMELIDVPRTRLQAEALPDTWPARKQLYPDVVTRWRPRPGRTARSISILPSFLVGCPSGRRWIRSSRFRKMATVSPSSPATSPRWKKWLARHSRTGRSRLTRTPTMPTFSILQPAKTVKNCGSH